MQMEGIANLNVNWKVFDMIYCASVLYQKSAQSQWKCVQIDLSTLSS